MEKHAYDRGKADGGEAFPGLAIDHRLAEQLHHALDEYEGIVGTIRYPHKRDPLVRTVHLTAPAAVAIRLKDSVPSARRTVELRQSLNVALDNEQQSRALWPTLQAEVRNFSPAAKLSEVLTKMVGRDRLPDLLPKPANGIPESVEDAILQHGVSRTLRGLAPEELSAVVAAICGDPKKAVVHGSGMEDAVDSILIALGIYAGAESDRIAGGKDDVLRRLQ